jgi:NAD(P)-dependent dehydrogenase (short-subunit alcohol dehydrogenase family)
VSSVLGLAAEAYSSAYSASKFAIRGLTDSIRQEVYDAPDIRVCTVFPFAIDTPIYQHGANFTGHKVGPIHPRYAADIVARAIVRLARRPRPEIYAGGLAALVPRPAAIAPLITTRIIRRAAQIMQIHEDEAAVSEGNAFEPIRDNLKVSGGCPSLFTCVQVASKFLLGVSPASHPAPKGEGISRLAPVRN